MIKDFFSRLFPSASPDQSLINSLSEKYSIFCALLIIGILGAILIAIVRFNAKRRPQEPKQITGNRILEISWTVIPLIIVTYFVILAIHIMAKINKPVPKGQAPDILIIAHQWWWEMHYPKYKVVTANELHIPYRERLLMRVESADVIHNWWVPALGPKIDAVPRHPNYMWIEADTAGLYQGTCSEYCGAEHAWMRINVIAQTMPEFTSWIHDQQKIPPLPTDSIGLAGAKLFQQKTCAVCHTINGTPATGRIGPDLSHIGSRHVILSGKFPNTKQNLINFLANPQKAKEGILMPDFMLSHNEVNELATYLEELK